MVTKSLSPDKTSQNDSGEPLAEQLMDYRRKKKKKTPLVPDIYPLPFPLWFAFWLWLDAHNLKWGLPPTYGYVCKPVTLSVWYLDRTWLHPEKIISFETNCCKLQNPVPVIHLVQTWILRVLGSPSTDSSVEAQEETRALWIFHTQSRMSLGSRTFLSAPLSPAWSVCPSVSLCPLYSRLLWILPTFYPPHQFSANVH